MKWHTPDIKIGQLKVVKKFLWFPLTICQETRWLETAHVTYQVTKYYYGKGCLPSLGYTAVGWAVVKEKSDV